MTQDFDFIVVGAGSSGAVLAARLSEDPGCRVALLEAGGTPPAEELMPAACPVLQLNPETDWAYTADPGKAGRGLREQRMMVPRGKMLGGCSGLNYLAYVRGHPGDYDAWAEGGAEGWGYEDVLPYFKKSEGLQQSAELPVEPEMHNTTGPLGVALRQPVLTGAQDFVRAAEAAGIRQGDYNGEARRSPDGVVSLFQTTTRQGKRSSTYRAFLQGEVEQRDNLTIVTGAQVTRVLLQSGASGLEAVGVAYRQGGSEHTIRASKEVVLCAGAVGSPHQLMLSGIGPRAALEAVGIACVLDAPHVGQHLKDHVHLSLTFPAPGGGVAMQEMGLSMGPDALRAPAGPLPADPADDVGLSPELLALKQEAEHRLTEWVVEGRGLVSSSLYDAAAWYSTGLGDEHTHDAQISMFCCGYNEAIWQGCLRVDPKEYFENPQEQLRADAESLFILANPVQPHSEGEIRLVSSDPLTAPDIRMNYYDDPHDMKVMLAIIRRALDVAAHWPAERPLGAMLVPPFLAKKHGYSPGDTPSDALLEDLALHYSMTVYHLTSTCRIGDVVDAELRVLGVSRLRVADASVMPNVISGNTNAPAIMIGEKAAEMIARAHGIELREFVG